MSGLRAKRGEISGRPTKRMSRMERERLTR
jgi:hypothetical protein